MTIKNREAVWACLQRLEEETGTLRVDDVIDEARDPDSPLHTEFDWDDSVAAEKWRREQARELIRTVRVEIVIQNHTIIAPAYVRDPSAGTKEQSYVSTVRIRNDKDTARDALMYEIDRIESSLARARNVAAALGLEAEVDAMVAGVLKLRAVAKKKSA